MTDIALWVRHGTPEKHWQLGTDSPVGTRWTLIGWDCQPAPVDAGVPPAVRRVFAHALAEVARVTFVSTQFAVPGSAGWSPIGADAGRELHRDGWASPLLARLRQQPDRLSLVSTRSAQTIEQMFDDDGFPWVMQAQIALLSPPDMPPPDVDFGSMAELLEGRWPEDTASLARLGVQAILRPAVDGDAVGLVGLAGSLDERFVASLAEASSRNSMQWRALP